MFLLFSVLFAVWCFYHSTFSAQRYDNFHERQKHTLINLLFWSEWNLPLAKFLSVENNKPLKDLRTVWMIGCQVKTYYLCCSLFLLFRQSFISVAGCRFKPNRWIGKGFGAVYSPTEEETAPNGLPLDLFVFKWGLATFASDKGRNDWRCSVHTIIKCNIDSSKVTICGWLLAVYEKISTFADLNLWSK